MRVLFVQKYLPQEMLGISWLCTALKRAGHEPRVLLIPDKAWEQKLVDAKPGLIAFSTTTGDHALYLRIAQRVKQLSEVPIVFGGPHPTFVPKIVEEPPVDFVCRGEGDEALPELATRLEAGEDTDDLPNLSFVKDGVRQDNPVRPLVLDMDTLGAPDRAPLYEAGQLYRDCERKVFLTHRGCAYSCSFCFHHAYRDKLYKVDKETYVRKRSVDQVLAEVDDVARRWPLKFAHFVDDIFNVNDEWLAEFCERYPKEVGIPFDVILRTNLTTREHIQQMRSAGCISARLAFEAHNDTVRNKVYRKQTTLADLTNSARYVKEEGIRLTTLNLLGSPGSTIEDDLKTLQLNVDCKVDHPLCSLLQPYPETDINEITKEMGFAIDSFDDFPEKYNRSTAIHLEKETEIENLHHLFPIAVRFPFLMPLVKPAIRLRFLNKAYLVAYLLWTEYLVCEQNQSYAVATNTNGLRTLPPVDLVRRVASKGWIKSREALFGRKFSKQKLKLVMETDTVAHAGG